MHQGPASQVPGGPLPLLARPGGDLNSVSFHKVEAVHHREPRTTARSVAAGLAGLVFTLCLAAAPRVACAKTVLVIASHPGDEVLIAAGRVRGAILAGDTVKIALVTNGDIGGTSLGLVRQGESVGAAHLLGVAEQDVIFLGYGEGSLRAIFDSTSETQVFQSLAGRTATYGDRGLGAMDYHRYLTGVSGSYNRATVLEDLRAVMTAYRPDEIYTLSHFDGDPDHQATALLVTEALISLKRSGLPLSTRLLQTFVRAPGYGGCADPTWPQVDPGGFTPRTPFLRSRCFEATQVEWERIQRFPVPAEMQSTDPSANLKYLAINQHASHVDALMRSFVRKDEFFWVTDLGTNHALTAQVTVSSESAGGPQGGVKAIDGVPDGSPHDAAREWVTAGELSGAWIQLDWPTPVSLAQVNLFDRPSTGENVLAGTLSFSDGSRVAVDALPADGRVLPVAFAPRVVSWVRFTVDRAEGSATGLSELQVLGIPAGSTANVPPLFNWGPVATPDSIDDAHSATLAAAGNDLDGDSYSYGWLSDGGTIQGSGPTALFRPPLVAENTVFTITAQILDGHGGVGTNVNFVTVAPAPPPASLTSLLVSPGSVVGGIPSTGTVTLSAAAPVGGAVVTLGSSNASVTTVPVSVTVAAGATTATFAVTTSVVAAATSVTISAAFAGVTRTSTLTVTPVPPAATLASVSLDPTTVVGGVGSTGTVTLSAGAPLGGAVVTLSSSSASATVPGSVTVAAGATTATFAVTTSVVTASTSVMITANFGSATQTASLAVTPVPAALASVSVNPASVVGGTGSTGMVTLTTGAP